MPNFPDLLRLVPEHHSDSRSSDDLCSEKSTENLQQRSTKRADIPLNCDSRRAEVDVNGTEPHTEEEDPYAELEMYLERVKVSNICLSI
ncbi:hypothetical protein DMENIID0001_073660 [Sergentomyia squamirostris]